MQYFSLIFLTIFYILANVHYYPGQWLRTAYDTSLHMARMAPFSIGCTILLVIVFQRMLSAKLPWDRVARIFLMVSIIFQVIWVLNRMSGSAQGL
jgi:hypothetical protein